jgi:hypothetical protein
VTLLAPDGGISVIEALMALDRLVVATGLLVLLGATGFVAIARLATPALGIGLPAAIATMDRGVPFREPWLIS